MFLKKPFGESWATTATPSSPSRLWNFTWKNAVFSSVMHCVKTFMSPLLLRLSIKVDTIALNMSSTIWPSLYKWSKVSVEITSRVLTFIKNKPIVVPTKRNWGSKSPKKVKLVCLCYFWRAGCACHTQCYGNCSKFYKDFTFLRIYRQVLFDKL